MIKIEVYNVLNGPLILVHSILLQKEINRMRQIVLAYWPGKSVVASIGETTGRPYFDWPSSGEMDGMPDVEYRALLAAWTCFANQFK